MGLVGREELKISVNGKRRHSREGNGMKDQDESLLKHCRKSEGEMRLGREGRWWTEATGSRQKFLSRGSNVKHVSRRLV